MTLSGTPRQVLFVRCLAALLLTAPLFVVPSASAQAATTLSWVRRASGLEQPTQVTSANDGSSRLFVVEKAGRILVVRGGKVLAKPFLDISKRVKTDGEGGLLSVAFHPDYVEHPFFWVAYTNAAGDVRVARFRAKGPHADSARERSEKRVFTVPHPDQFTNHFGGQLVFGSGGNLFMSTGDGGGGGDPFNHGQSKKSLQGKILRLKVLGAKRACDKFACVPHSNPYAGKTPGLGAIWLTGLRNAWRFSVDDETGDLWIGDVGQDAVEEVDQVTRGGLNLGWSCREGNRVYNADRCKPGRSYLEPAFTYDHGYGQSITGGFVYRGVKFATALNGRYIAGDFVSGKVFYSAGDRLVTAGELPSVTSFGEDDANEIWAVTIDGGLFQMSA